MSAERATKKQQALLEFVDTFIREHDYGPSYREIMSALGYKSVSTVAVHVDALLAKGYLERKDSSPRSLAVVGKGKNTSGVVTTADVEQKAREYIQQATLDDQTRVRVETLISALAILGKHDSAENLSKQLKARL